MVDGRNKVIIHTDAFHWRMELIKKGGGIKYKNNFVYLSIYGLRAKIYHRSHIHV